MPFYAFRCPSCFMRFESFGRILEAKQAPCPSCGVQAERSFEELVTIGVQVPHFWVEGKEIVQLHPEDPDRMVTSKRQMEEVYQKKGLSLETGQITDQKRFDASFEACSRKARARKRTPRSPRPSKR